jgi:hypothetical protein
MQRIPDANNTKRTDIQPNIGAGFKFKNLAVDYALAVMGDNTHTLYSNIFSLSYSFEKKD